MLDFELRGEGGACFHLAICDPRKTEHLYADEGWIAFRVQFEGNGFSAIQDGALLASEIQVFAIQLKDCQERLQGTAELTTTEEQFKLSLAYRSTGGVQASGHVGTPIGDTRLTFAFQTDQSYVAAALMQLESMTEAMAEAQ